MKDLQDPKLLWLKGFLFLGIGIASAVLLWAEAPRFNTALLLALSIWAFCRAYYFAFYVLEKHVDPSFRFAGLGSFVLYLVRHRNQDNRAPSPSDEQER